MSGSSFNYKFGTKNNWRRWAWNRLSSACKDGVVLYLAGERDLDRAVAIQKGFDPRNMIAVEQDSGAVAELRRRGVNCIHGDLQAVLKSWGKRRVSVVFGDFCSGIPKNFHITLCRLAVNPCFADTQCAWNFMRGRESWHKESTILTDFFQSNVFGTHRGQAVVGMHRGAFNWACANMLQDLWEKQAEAIEPYNETHSPQFHTYRSSSGQLFDSCCYLNWSLAALCLFTVQRCNNPVSIRFAKQSLDLAVSLTKSAGDYKGKIAAAMAIRTCRQAQST